MMLQGDHIPCHSRRHDTGPESGSFLLLIADAPALSGMLRTEARRLGFLLHNEGLHLVVPGRHQRTGYTIQVDPLIPLVDVVGFRLIQHHRRVMCFCPQRTGYFLGHIHPGPALVVEDDPLCSGAYFSCDVSEASVRSSTACLSRAFRRISGSSLPRAEALRSIP